VKETSSSEVFFRYYHIKNDHTGHYLKATSSLKVKTKPTKSESAAYRWKFVLLEREDKCESMSLDSTISRSM
jgi:hypothetical protein